MTMVRRRLSQFVSAVTASVTPGERTLLAELLNARERRLFERMPLFDQRHSLDVYHTLVRAGHAEPALLKAALLHDCGKVDDNGRGTPLLYYGIFVVLQRITPGIYRWAARNGRGPLRPFAVHAEHDRRSAALIEQAGSPEVAAIVRDYGTGRRTAETSALSWADNQH
jgi:hypothetical protein